MVDNNNIEALIARAREFARKSLSDNLDEVNREDYLLFQISKFLLLKESMIKKDSNESTIYFNIDENHQYLKAIKYIVDYVREKGSLISNNIDVVIMPLGYPTSDDLERYIRDFHKIRDTIAHGCYHIDSDKGCIVLDNDNLKPGCPADSSTYVIRGELPIDMLELFTYIFENPKDIYSEYEINVFDAETKKIRKQFGYDNPRIFNIHIKIDEYNNTSSDVFLSNSKKKEQITHQPDDVEIIIKNVREKEKTLLQLIRKMFDSSYSDEHKTHVLNQLRKLNLITSNKPELVDFDTNLKHEQNVQLAQSYIIRMDLIIEEISRIIGISNNPKDNMKISSVYNYMQLFLSFKHESINPKNKRNLAKLKISKINPEYVYSEKPDYAIKITAIKKYVKEKIIDVFKSKLDKYNDNPNENFRKSINKLFKDCYEELLRKLANRNADIITSIRNSIEHGNIEVENGNIKLHDQSNQNDQSTINFKCAGSPQDFYEIICCVDSDQEQTFTFDDFMTEMQIILDEEMFEEFSNIVEGIRTVNNNSLDSVLKQVPSKK